MAVFEAGWRPDLPEEEGKKLVRDAIAAGIFNDLGSGSNVDLCVIRGTGPAQYLRTYEEANIKVLYKTVLHLKKSVIKLHVIALVEVNLMMSNFKSICILGQEAGFVQICPWNNCSAEAEYHPSGCGIGGRAPCLTANGRGAFPQSALTYIYM